MQTHPLSKHAVKTSLRSEIVDVTDALRRIVQRNNVTEGMAIVYIPHTTPWVAQLPTGTDHS